MNLDELEEALAEILPADFHIDTDKHGEVIIFTGLRQDDDGELVGTDQDEEDADFDPDFEPLEDEDEDED